jgi:hypothetical protein
MEGEGRERWRGEGGREVREGGERWRGGRKEGHLEDERRGRRDNGKRV